MFSAQINTAVEEQSFADIENNFEKLIAAVGQITGYAPPAAEITTAALQTLFTDYDAKNSELAGLAQQVSNKQRERLDAYDGDAGLREKMKAIKQGVQAQYGNASPKYDQIKGIRV